MSDSKPAFYVDSAGQWPPIIRPVECLSYKQECEILMRYSGGTILPMGKYMVPGLTTLEATLRDPETGEVFEVSEMGRIAFTMKAALCLRMTLIRRVEHPPRAKRVAKRVLVAEPVDDDAYEEDDYDR
jgi:hypothetical protein